MASEFGITSRLPFAGWNTHTSDPTVYNDMFALLDPHYISYLTKRVVLWAVLLEHKCDPLRIYSPYSDNSWLFDIQSGWNKLVNYTFMCPKPK